MRSSLLFYVCLGLLSALTGWGRPGVDSAYARQPQAQAEVQGTKEQADALLAAAQIKDPQERARAVEQFMTKYPDTPFKADVYNMLFMSYREFSRDDERVWKLGEQFLDALTLVADTKVKPFMKNPLLAQAYNSVAYEFSEREAHLDGAIEYAQQALSLIRQAAMAPPPDIPKEEWVKRIDAFRGQILDTLGWIQFKRKALPDAEKAVSDAVALIPENGTVHFHLGRIQTARNQDDKAIDAYLMAATAGQPEKEAEGELHRLFRSKYGASGEGRLATALEKARVHARMRLKERVLKNRVNKTALDASFNRLNGETPVSLSSLKGKVIVINFWATWCPPCRKEMPALQKVWKSYRDKNVAFIIASVDQEQEKIQPYIDKYQYTFPVYRGLSAAKSYGVQSIPTTLVVDPQGVIQYIHVGYHPDIELLLGWQIDALMGE